MRSQLKYNFHTAQNQDLAFYFEFKMPSNLRRVPLLRGFQEKNMNDN